MVAAVVAVLFAVLLFCFVLFCSFGRACVRVGLGEGGGLGGGLMWW